MVCTSLGSLLRPLFYFLCYIHFSLSVQLTSKVNDTKGCRTLGHSNWTILSLLSSLKKIYF